MPSSTKTYKTIDNLILWSHHNSQHVLYQCSRFLQRYNIFMQDGTIRQAIYSTDITKSSKRIKCTLTMPTDKTLTFTAYGNEDTTTHASTRLATFRVIKQIFTHFYNIQWDTIKFNLIFKPNNEQVCLSNEIKISHNKKTIAFQATRIRQVVQNDGDYVKDGLYCRIGCGIEFMNKLCFQLEAMSSGTSKSYSKHFKQNRNRRRNYSSKTRPVSKRRRLNTFWDHDRDRDRGNKKSRSRFHSRFRSQDRFSNVIHSSNSYVIEVFPWASKVEFTMKMENLENNNLIVRKKGRKSVKEWNYYAVIYWLNRVNNGIFAHMKYANLRKHIIIGRVKGSELNKINDAIFKMIGLRDKEENEKIMNAMKEVYEKDNWDNVVADTMVNDNIPYVFFDPVSYEIMRDPVTLRISGIVYERSVIEQFINMFHKDPISEGKAYLSDLIPYVELKNKIDVFIKDCFDLNVD